MGIVKLRLKVLNLKGNLGKLIFVLFTLLKEEGSLICEMEFKLIFLGGTLEVA
jgi:hypothetical protein